VPTPDDRTRGIVRRLAAATEKGDVKWEARSDRMFVLATPTATVTVQSGDNEGDHPYFLEIKNPDGIVIGSGNTIPGAGYADWEDEIARLYSLARDKALGVDTTLDRFAAELGLPPDPDQFPF
jgi:hypothetical protein